MWKEISARTHTNGACNQPASHKEERLGSARCEKRDQAYCRKPPYNRLGSREGRERAPAIFKSRRRSNSADVFQVVRENIIDELMQSATPTEIRDHQPQNG